MIDNTGPGLTGALLIGAGEILTERRFAATAPATGATLDGGFSCAEPSHVAAACALADAAFDPFRSLPPEARAVFLERIATEIAALGDVLTERACAESGLPRGRIEGETGRATGQLRAFAFLLRRGDWQGVRLDAALPDRQPMPRPDLRQRRIGVGPVAVFGASNFPLAFPVAGGDTAAALAAGCPVVARAHPAHPGTSELVGRAIRAAVQACRLPEGVFSLLGGPDQAIGAALVADPHVAAVGFTGSRAGGLALARIAASRPVPIPVHAEMSSVNPVFLLPAALAEDPAALAAGFVASMSLGAGQFCTNPGLVLVVRSAALDAFAAEASARLSALPAATMLSAGIQAAYDQGCARLAARPDVAALADGQPATGPTGCRAALFRTDAASFRADPALADEVFGAVSLLVVCDDEAELVALARTLEGQLTATLHLRPADGALARRLLPVLERKAGRILANGWPTGVEVSDAMVHGGPFPATTDPRGTSVGTAAIERFLRPVCYQDLPADLLPPDLADDNPLGLLRLLNGRLALPA